MSYLANLSLMPPANSGDSKMLWSPELFDSVTGTYPISISNRPSTITYPADTSGRLHFYEGSQLSGPSRYWPTADDSGASAAYSAGDKVLSDLSQATGSYSWGASAPSVSNGEAVNEVSVIFSFAGCSADATPRALKAYICMDWGAEHKSVTFPIPGHPLTPIVIDEASGISSSVSLDGGATWGGGIAGSGSQLVISKTLFSADIGTADPNLVRIKVTAGAATKDGVETEYGYNDPFHLDCSASCEVFALCIEG